MLRGSDYWLELQENALSIREHNPRAKLTWDGSCPSNPEPNLKSQEHGDTEAGGQMWLYGIERWGHQMDSQETCQEVGGRDRVTSCSRRLSETGGCGLMDA